MRYKGEWVSLCRGCAESFGWRIPLVMGHPPGGRIPKVGLENLKVAQLEGKVSFCKR